MRIKTITAANMADALRVIRDQLGPEALILATKKTKNEKGEPTLEITAALKDEDVVASTVRPEAVAARPAEAARTALPERRGAAVAVGPLAQHHIPADLLAKLEGSLPALQAAGFGLVDALEMLLGKLLPLRPPGDMVARGGVHVLVGPTGAGKTTLLTKLAQQHMQAGTRVGMMSLDDTHAAGFARLQQIANGMGERAYLLQSPADLRAAAAHMGPRQMLLLDTPGISSQSPESMKVLAARLNDLELPLTVHLVLPANLFGATLATMPLAFGMLNPTSVIFSKLDDTEYVGPLVGALAAHRLAGGMFTHSPRPDVPPQPLSARYLAEVLSAPPVHPWEYDR